MYFAIEENKSETEAVLKYENIFIVICHPSTVGTRQEEVAIITMLFMCEQINVVKDLMEQNDYDHQPDHILL